MANERENRNDPDMLDEVGNTKVRNSPESSRERIGGTSGEDIRGIAADRDEEFEDADDLEDEEEPEDESDGTI